MESPQGRALSYFASPLQGWLLAGGLVSGGRRDGSEDMEGIAFLITRSPSRPVENAPPLSLVGGVQPPILSQFEIPLRANRKTKNRSMIFGYTNYNLKAQKLQSTTQDQQRGSSIQPSL